MERVGKRPWAPTPEQALLVRACLSDCADLEHLVRNWEANYNFDDIDYGCMRLLPFLYRKLETCGVTAVNHGRIKGIYARYWYLHNTRAIPSLTLLAQLQTDGYQFLILKGTSLQSLVYGQDPPTRPADDVDILVTLHDLPAWVSTLTSRGFHSTSHYSLEYSASTRKSMGWESSDSSIDLNWRINEFSLDAAFENRVFERSVPIKIRDFTFNSPSIPDHFLHTILHGSGWNSVPTVRWVLDACLLAQTMTQADWEIVAQETRVCGWRTPMLEQLEYLRGQFQAQIPANIIERVAQQKPSRAGMLAHRALTRPTRKARRQSRVLYSEYLNRRDFTGAPGLAWKYPLRAPGVLTSMLREYRRSMRQNQSGT